MTGLVTICVWIEPICPKTVDTVKYKHKVHQTITQISKSIGGDGGSCFSLFEAAAKL